MAGKNRRLMQSKIHQFFIFLIFIFFNNGFSQSSKNYLIVENPFDVNIYNKYEQNLSSNDSSYFLPYCPIEIIAEDTLLSDQYTSAFIGKINNQLFYFIKSENNISFNKLFDSYSSYIKNAKSLMDTIQIVQDNKVLFYNAKDKRQKERLAIDTKLVRIFKKGTQTYVKILDKAIKYGWCDLNNSKAWTNFQIPKKEKIEDIAAIESVIKKKLSDTNNVIQKLFIHFNKLNRVNIQLPYWTYLNKENEFVCTMLNNENNYDFTESTNILINELQLVLAHTNYNVVWQSNEIVIQKNR